MEGKEMEHDNYVAWCRYIGKGENLRIVTCDSNDEGAFKVWREPPPVSSSSLVTGYVRCGAKEGSDCKYRSETYQNVYDGIFVESEQARLIVKLTELLQEALPHIECKTKEQDNLITEIGKLVST